MLALAAVLAVLWLLGPHGPGFSADDAALAAQVEALADGSWTRPHPLLGLDPDGGFHPDHFAVRTADGEFAAYVKHPLAPLLLVPGWELAGRIGAELVVLAGVLAAAVAVSRVVRLTVPVAATPALWLVGVGSAVVLHGFVLWLHGWALAATALSVESALRAISGRRPAEVVRSSVVLLAGLTVAILLRGEGLLAAGAVAVGLAVAAGDRRRWDLAMVAGLTASWAVTVMVLEAAAVDALVGPVTSLAPPAEVGYLSGRVTGSFAVFLLAATDPLANLARLLPLAALVAACHRLRGSAPGPWVALVVGGCAAAYVAAVALLEPSTVYGFVPGLPLAILPLALPGSLDRAVTRPLGAMAATYVALVAATTHAAGAGSDWGGRYALLVVPMLATLVADRLATVARSAPAVPARAVVAALLIMSITTAPAAYLDARSNERRADRVIGAVVAGARALPSAPDTGRPVVVTTSPVIGRLLALDDAAVTPLTVQQPERLGELLALLARRGVSEVVVVGSARTLGPDATLDTGGWTLGPTRWLTDGTVLRIAIRR